MLVRYEMQWTVRYFIYERDRWIQRRTTDCSAGAKAYASRQAAIWAGRAASSNARFKTVDPRHVSLI